MRTARPALGWRLGRSALTTVHRTVVRARLTLRSRSGRSGLTIFHRKIVRAALTLRLRSGRSGLTTVHRTVVRAALALGSRLGRSPGKRSTGAFPSPAHPHSSATAENTPSDREIAPSG